MHSDCKSTFPVSRCRLDLFSRAKEREKIEFNEFVFSHVDDIDIYVGGVLETPIKDAAVGPTFACLNSEQFRALKKGDRSWFENPGSFSYGKNPLHILLTSDVIFLSSYKGNYKNYGKCRCRLSCAITNSI